MTQDLERRAISSDSVILPTVVYEPRLSHDESWGGRARRLWEDRFREIAEFASDSEVIFTGLGQAPFENRDKNIKIARHGDGTEIPFCVDLNNQFGRTPKALFLVASAFNDQQVIALKGLARKYKEDYGVEYVIPVLTALAEERQDHEFTDALGNPVPQPTLLKEIIHILSEGTVNDRRIIDGVVLVQPHSLRPIELGIREDLPILPIDAFNLLVKGAELDKVENPFVLGPDKGRKDEARILASMLRCPMGSAKKTRDRGTGKPKVDIPDEILQYIKANKCNVIVVDDEARQGGTLHEIALGLDGYAESIIYSAVKAILAKDGDKTAVDHLLNPLISQLYFTDAVKPLNDESPLVDKLTWVRLGPEIEKLVKYLQKNLVRPDDPNWLRDPQETGTLLRLDISVEQYE